MGVLVKKKTLQEPLSIQVDLNRGIKEGLIIIADETIDEKEIIDTQFRFSN